MTSVWMRWLASASLAALLVSVVELAVLILPVGYARSSPMGLLAFFWSSHALILLGLAPLAIAAALCDKRAPSIALPPAAVILAVTSSLLLIAPLSRPLLMFRSGERNEFPGIMVELPGTLLLLLLVLACVFCWLIALPLSRKLVARFGDALSPGRVISVPLGLLAVLAHWTAYQGLEPLNLGVLAGAGALSAAALWMVALRRVLGGAGRGLLLALLVPAVLFVFALPMGLSGLSQLHARFLLFNHSVAARTVGARLHDVGDFDGDGTAPTWLAGTDCAPFDGERGPGIFDVAGDGIDQDCSGHDRVYVDPPAAVPDRCTPATKTLSVLLITIDAWRFDTMFSEFTAGISDFARQSLFFGSAYVPASLTKHSIAAVLSGQPSAELRAKNPLTTDEPVSSNALVRAAQDSGMATVALHYLDFPPGYDAGFAPRATGHWLAPEVEVSPGGDHMADFRSASLTGQLLAWLDARGDERFFAWVHYTDPHAPYLDPNASGPLAKYNGTYRGELAYTDFQVSRALKAISDRGLAKSTAIAITADHGEELGEYNRQGHGTNVFENTAHVPLILWVPGCRPEYIDDPVSLVQLAPTLARLAGLQLPGHSLLGQMPSPPNGVISEAVSTEFAGDEHFFKRAFIHGRYKLIDDVRRGGRLLFDLAKDPAETRNIWYEQVKARTTVLQAYRKWLDSPTR